MLPPFIATALWPHGCPVSTGLLPELSETFCFGVRAMACDSARLALASSSHTIRTQARAREVGALAERVTRENA